MFWEHNVLLVTIVYAIIDLLSFISRRMPFVAD